VPLNLVFGVSAAWAIASTSFRASRFDHAGGFTGFSVSPVVAGLMANAGVGAQGWLGHAVEHDIKIIFAVPGMCAGHGVCDFRSSRGS
jgi:sulfate transport system permease protein